VSEDFLNNPYSLLGLIIGAVICLIVYFINRAIGKKKRLFDERYYQQTNRAKARSWDAMLVIYILAWVIVIIFDGISFSFYLITSLYVLQNITLIITNLYVSKNG